ncbi:MAG: cytochrome c biogenesis CcdA family protein, partial [Candidatus Bathyarchaeia archaeon]
LFIFLIALVLQGPFHMSEHIAQVIQAFVLGQGRAAHGLVGQLDLEWSHFIFNALLLGFIAATWFTSGFHKNSEWKAYSRLFYYSLLAAFLIQTYHSIEHGAKLIQHLQTGLQGTPGIVGFAGVDLVWAHFFFNLAVLVLPAIAFFGFRFHSAGFAKPEMHKGLVIFYSVFAGIFVAHILAFTGVMQRGFALEFLLVVPLREQIALSGVTLGVAVAFLAGVSMIALPCGYPLLFTLTPQSARMSSKHWLASLGFFAIGIGTAMAIVGIIVSLIGGLFLDTLLTANPIPRVSTAAVVYGAIGLIALLMAVRSLGFLGSFKIPGFDNLTQLLTGKVANIGRGYKQMLSFGALYGGGMSAGCPVPVYWGLLFWAALVGNVGFGALLLGVHGLGYVAPLIPIGILVHMGFGKWVQRGLSKRGPLVESMMTGGLIAFGVFMIMVFAVMVPLSTFGIIDFEAGSL